MNKREEIDTIIKFILNLANISHPQVETHLKRVGKLSRAVGESLNKDSYACYVAGTLHDVGKLLLPYKLFDGHDINQEEYDIIKNHVFLGYNMLKNDYLFTALVISLHHNVSNKKGYGLNINEFNNFDSSTIQKILETAKIVSICDFIDAYRTRDTKSFSDGKLGSDLKSILYEKYPDDKNIIDVAISVDISENPAIM